MSEENEGFFRELTQEEKDALAFAARYLKWDMQMHYEYAGRHEEKGMLMAVEVLEKSSEVKEERE